MQDGKVSLPYKRFLGYEKGENGLPQIVESEAVIVRLIYAMFLRGKTAGFIADHLTQKCVPTPAKKLAPWSVSTVMSILQNEKYSGNALLQKGYTVNFLTKETKKNEGEVPQYYVENSHPGIVTPEVYDMVQAEMKRRRERSGRQSGQHCFSGKVFCGECSGAYGSKVWHSTGKYKRTIWRCNRKYETRGVTGCSTPHLTEAQLEFAFVEAFNRILTDRDTYFDEYDSIVGMLTDTTALDKEAVKLNKKIIAVCELVHQSIDQNAHFTQDQAEYRSGETKLTGEYTAAKTRLEAIAAEKSERSVRKENLTRFLDELRRQDHFLTVFDPALFRATVDVITVHSEKDVAVTFRDGADIHVNVNKK